MSCSACSANVEKAVKNLDGVANASVNLLTNSMTVDFNESLTGSAEIVEAVVKAGYGAAVVTDNARRPATDKAKSKPDTNEICARIAVSFALLLLFVSMGHMLKLPPRWPHGASGSGVNVSSVPAYGTQVFVNRKYYSSVQGFVSTLAEYEYINRCRFLGGGFVRRVLCVSNCLRFRARKYRDRGKLRDGAVFRIRRDDFNPYNTG